eukprot:TRINITY_DN2278_c0_g1_i2.p1 TRINITY_DN2278_c0_g1~~TRINITY_DN2278_c0_g1_i2.p1  ORF type:complete len:311 (+),score=96.36 TRINITY_DN2278_c0_g1_i2:195-1127(+)
MEAPQCPGSQDLMAKLKKKSGGLAGSVMEPVFAEGADPDLEEPAAPPERPNAFPEDSPLTDFFDAVKEVDNNCKFIVWITPKYAAAALELTSAVDVKQTKESEEKVKKLLKQSKTVIKKNKKTIDEMDQEMQNQMQLDVDEVIASGEIEKKDAPNVKDGQTLPEWGPYYRVMYNCRWSLVNQWKRVNKAYNEEQAACDRRKRTNLTRQLTIANGCEPSEEEVNSRLNNGATDVFSGGMVARASDADADYANEFLAEAEEELKKIMLITKGMQEMQEMWDEFQLLLAKQGELLNTISGNLQKCKDLSLIHI